MLQFGKRHLPICGENRDRDGQIKGGPLLSKIARGEIADDEIGGKFKLRACDRAANADTAFAHSLIGQAHHLEVAGVILGLAAKINFDHHRQRINFANDPLLPAYLE